MAYATSDLPAWLWSTDATRILWANPTAAAIFNAPSAAALASHTIDPNGPAAIQVARIAATLPLGAAPRLERLRGLGGRFGGALMCACSRIALADQTPAILVVSTEPVGPHLALEERARRLLAGCEESVALFNADGLLLHATPAAKTRLGDATTLAALGVAPLGALALSTGCAVGEHEAGQVSLERIGTGASTVLMARLPPQSAESAASPLPPPLESAQHDEAATPAIQPPQPATPPGPAARAPMPALQAPAERRRPLRFVWQMDVDGCFAVDSEEFTALLEPQTAGALGRPWNEIAATLGLDPEGQVARAIASRDTFSGITVRFAVDTSGSHLAVELSGLPVFDRDRNFRGYRGFGVCRDMAQINELLKRHHAGVAAAATAAAPRIEPPALREESALVSQPAPSENVVPFPSAAPSEKAAGLTAIERKAFSELASRLTARLRSADRQEAPGIPVSEPLAPPGTNAPPSALARDPLLEPLAAPKGRAEGRVTTGDQRSILDRLPVGVLVYRLDKLIYANRAFLGWTGYGELQALEEAGGLDALFIEPNSKGLGETNGAKALTITTNRGGQLPVEARLFTSPWEGESALVLMLATVSADDQQRVLETALTEAKAQAGELRAILDTATDGVVLLDRDGRVLSANRSAQALFGYEGRELSGLPFASLLAPESQRTALDYLNSLTQAGAGVFNDGREVLGRARLGGLMPLFMTVGAIADGTDRLCAVFRDITPWKKAEEELVNAKRQAEKASSAKSDFLAKISHEIRTPLNAIIGFSEVMMQERFGPISNDRYRQYLRDIKTSADHLVSLLNDLLDLSKIEAGKIELNFVNLDLNEITQQCVALMQPQANRERVIIRTALAPSLPPVAADARSVRQIVLNLLSNSIKFTGPGGQVIVSTALNDVGDAVLRVRDTGVGMSEQDLAVALEPFRQLATSARWGSGGSGLGLPLTKALAEANRASFGIKSAVNAGTLVEIAFRRQRLAAE
jgi:PAS domain S-box-containing protein